MRILLYVNSYLPRIGGREMVVHNLAQQFQAKGHDVVVTGMSGWRKHRHEDYGYAIHRRPTLPFLSADQSRSLFLAASALRRRFDVVHAHSTYPCGYAATNLAPVFGWPVVITPHGEDIHCAPEIAFGQRLDPVQRPKIERAVMSAHRLTAISEAVASSLREVGVPDERISKIPNGVDLARFQRESGMNVLDHFGFPSDTFLISTVGNYHPRKGHETLIKSIGLAHAEKPNVRLLVVGNRSQALSDAVCRMGLEDVVKFTGILRYSPGAEPDVLASILGSSAVYVSSSVHQGAEGLSLSLLEGMAAGACPVATAISGNLDVIVDESNGLLVRPADELDLAKAIVRLAGSPELRTRLVENSKQLASAYGWDTIADRYLELYQSVCDRG